MPSPRKRIGFLPDVEVQKIIDDICEERGLSQSRVTGLLVEEALKKRGLYEPKIDKKEFVNSLTEVLFSKNNSDKANNDKNIMESEIIADKNIVIEDEDNEISYTKNEFNLLKDYIEFKRFKYMMKRVNNDRLG